ncbi:MAG TPA: DedA family protein [Candidatus Paceibacterota bacterium]|nr:DedA family protein [Candidatus Paceibacterota bacterium]
MLHFDVENIIALLGYLGIFLLMIPNGIIGLPSSQLLYIVSGYFIGTGNLAPALVILAGALGNTLGNIALYEIVRRKGLEYLTKYKVFPKAQVLKIQSAFHRKGMWFLFVAKLLPAIKVFAPIPPAIGKMDRRVYAFVIFVSSAIWSLPFLAVGYFFGKNTNVLQKYALVLIPVAFIVVLVFYWYIERQPSGENASLKDTTKVEEI